MTCLQTLVIRGQCDAAPDQRLAFRLGVAEMLEKAAGIRGLEVEFRKLALGPLEYLAVGNAAIAKCAVEIEIVDALDPLDIHRQPFETVSQLGRDRIAFDATHLLEIGE